eukprot:TRINITY_DN3648_c0_g1_i1.p1 TRINITY_DN3648_c0_g1~~TRINITY_DN3648_c0_g1_i1.p1  ORF type:complete len:559 (-),score=100.97 TRINITY_DN3648_c0_g1_i1:41-1717(-)
MIYLKRSTRKLQRHQRYKATSIYINHPIKYRYYCQNGATDDNSDQHLVNTIHKLGEHSGYNTDQINRFVHVLKEDNFIHSEKCLLSLNETEWERIEGLPIGLIAKLKQKYTPEPPKPPKWTFRWFASNLTWKIILGAVVIYIFFTYYGQDIYDYLVRETYVQLEVDNKDDAFNWLMLWLTNLKYTNEDCKHLAVFSENRSSVYEQLVDYSLNKLNPDQDNYQKDVSYLPSTGTTHYFLYKGKIVWVNLMREFQAESKTSDIQEVITIGSFTRDRQFIQTIVDEAQSSYWNDRLGKTVIYAPDNNYSLHWEEVVRKPPRDPNSVILQEGIKEDIFDDLDNFKNSSEFYKERGIPYKRGYLFHGPPGTGKTSLIMSIAGQYKMDICILNLSSKNLTDEGLVSLIQKTPNNSIILLEDVDNAVFDIKDKRSLLEDFGEKPKISFSTLLNCLDGVTAKNGRILFMTANDRKKLPPVLIRAGRIDRQIEIGYSTEDQIINLYQHFYSHMPHERDGKGFVEYLKSRNYGVLPDISPATLQGHFIRHKSDPVAATKNADDLFNNK